MCHPDFSSILNGRHSATLLLHVFSQSLVAQEKQQHYHWISVQLKDFSIMTPVELNLLTPMVSAITEWWTALEFRITKLTLIWMKFCFGKKRNVFKRVCYAWDHHHLYHFTLTMCCIANSQHNVKWKRVDMNKDHLPAKMHVKVKKV